MELEKHKPEQRTSEFRWLKKAFSGSPDEFDMLQKAYTREELESHEQRLTSGSWDAKFLPGIVVKARERLETKSQIMKA